MNKEQIKNKIRQAIQKEPEKHIIKKISLFGSYLNDSANQDSDVDILIEFSGPIGLFGLCAIQRRFSEHLNKPVDLLTPDFLNKRFRSTVLDRSEQIYEQART